MTDEKDIYIDLNKVIRLEFQDGTKLDIQIFDGHLTKTQDIYFINNESPLAQAILKKKEGDKIKFVSDNKVQEVKILKVVTNPKHIS
jgi:transcription elongation GreA/GreB family factor